MPAVGLEIWTAGVGIPHSTAGQARRAADEGWDGMGVVDSQNLAADPYIELAIAAGVTSTLLLGTAVTNPITRHPAVAATAAATVHAESSGRMVLGIGRGDSSLAHLGLAPAPVDVFSRYVSRLQAYLRGEDVAFDQTTDGAGQVPPSGSLGLAGGPDASRVRWISGLPKVPVDVAATGPKVIAAGAALAERVTFAVGASVERVGWAVDLARAACAAAGRSVDDLGLGIYVPIAVHRDQATARALVAGGVASYARFSVMHGRVAGPTDEAQREVLSAVHDAYDMNRHFTHGSPQSSVLTEDVIDTFGIAGPPAYCVERLIELIDLGLTKVFLLGPGMGADRDDVRASRQLLVTDVLPAVRR